MQPEHQKFGTADIQWASNGQLILMLPARSGCVLV
jgi:hypothetical protein